MFAAGISVKFLCFFVASFYYAHTFSPAKILKGTLHSLCYMVFFCGCYFNAYKLLVYQSTRQRQEQFLNIWTAVQVVQALSGPVALLVSSLLLSRNTTLHLVHLANGVSVILASSSLFFVNGRRKQGRKKHSKEEVKVCESDKSNGTIVTDYTNHKMCDLLEDVCWNPQPEVAGACITSCSNGVSDCRELLDEYRHNLDVANMQLAADEECEEEMDEEDKEAQNRRRSS